MESQKVKKEKKKKVTPIGKIDPDRFYSVMESMEFMSFRARQTLVQHINDKNIIAISVNFGTQKRYAIKGTWLIEFLTKRINKIPTKSYQKEQMIGFSRIAIDYARKQGFTTIDELEHHIETSF